MYEDCKKTKWHAFDNEIYYYLKWQDAKLNKISQALKDAASIHPGLIGVMASLPEMQSFALSRKMSLNTLKQLADNTDRIIVGAYDGEGYLVWYEPTKVALEEKEVGNP